MATASDGSKVAAAGIKPATVSAPAGESEDERRLHELGYAQELRRHMSAFSNFAVSFTIISVLSGCLTLYGYGLTTGGPAEIVWSWPIVGILVMFVGLAMAEVCSSFPTAGGLYYFSAKLSKPEHAPVVSWFTGWFNLLGEVAVTAGIDFGAAFFLNAFLDLQFGFSATPPHTIFLYACILVLHGLLNTFGVSVIKILSNVSVWWHILGVMVIVGVLAFVPSHHQSASFVFGHFENQTGWQSWVYVMFIGILLAQYTYTGYDASAHMSEETVNAAVEAPRGIVSSIWVSILAGWLLLIGVTFAIQDYHSAVNTTTGVPPAQIFIDALGKTGGELLLLIAIVAQLFCGMASVAANSRMIYAFSRDGAVPGHRLWHKVNPRTRTPTNAVWFAAVGAFILGLPYLWNATAYAAVTSIAVIGLYIAYVVPSFLRFLRGDSFQPGPWNLGRWGRPIALIATIWVAIIVIIFLLPTVSPVTRSNFNYTIIAVLVVIGYAGIYWLVSARKWFKGPRVQGSAEELKAAEEDLKKAAT